jgi:lipopolysaccharide heptosyltransferase II
MTAGPAPTRRTTGTGRRIASLVVRAPNHLGDLVMALPALEAAGPVDVLVAAPIAPLLAMSRMVGTILPLARGTAAFASTVRQLRRARYARAVLLTPSFSSAFLFAASGIPRRRGTDTDARRLLLTDPVPFYPFTKLHRAASYWTLLSNDTMPDPLRPRLTVPDEARERWLAQPLGGQSDGPLIGLFPGGNAPSRRWSPESFATLARRLVARGARVVVFGGPAERALTAQVASTHAIDLGGQTDLPLLAAGLAACDLVVSNDSGPLHMAAAVGTPTISCWGAGDPRITGPLGPHQRVVRHAELPCVPCARNVCPRSGRGTQLPDAHNECLALITVDEIDALIPLAS